MRRAAILGLVAAFVVLVTGSVANSAAAKIYWGRGVEAVLPADAATNKTQAAGIDWVSCPSAGNCGAVGTYVDKSGKHQGALLNETAGKWASGVEAVPPGSYTHVWWNGLSCASAGNCTAIGSYDDYDSNTDRLLLLTETAGVWGAGVQAKLPAPEGAGSSAGSLFSVSCASAGNCVAVGHYGDGSGNVKGVLLTETDGVWATGVEAPLPVDAGTTGGWVDLASVSCPSVGNCTAVGDYTDTAGDLKPLLLDETSGSWTADPKPRLPANAVPTHDYFPEFALQLESVSCASAGNCSAVGFYCAVGNCKTTGNLSRGSTGREALLLTESGGKWAKGIEAALPSNAAKTSPVAFVNSISCASAGNCSAVGDYYDAALHDRLLLLTESAGHWSKGEQGVLPADARISGNTLANGFSVFLSSVSCRAPGTCTAAGVYPLRGGRGNEPVVLREKAGEWATGFGVVLPANAVARHRDSWATVSCGSTQSCAVVGDYATAVGQQGLLVDGPSLISFVPDVKGKTLAAAKRSIRSHGCSVGKIRHVRSRSVKKGRVISQTPKPGRAVKPGARVRLEVSSG